MRTNSIANRLRLVIMLSAVMVIIFTLVIGFFSYQIKSTSEKIVQDDLPFSINSLLMFEELVHMNSNLLEYLLGESQIVESYDVNYSELMEYRNKMPKLAQHEATLTQIDGLIEKFNSTAKNEVFNQFSPDQEKQAINDIATLISKVGVPLEHVLDEFKDQEIITAQTSIVNEELRAHLSIVRFYLELVDIGGDMIDDLNRFILGDVSAKTGFESHSKDFKLFLNQLYSIDSRYIDNDNIAEIDALYQQLVHEGEKIFNQYDPTIKANAVHSVEQLEHTTFYQTDTLLDTLSKQGRETVKSSVAELNAKANLTLMTILILSVAICSLLLFTFSYAQKRIFVPIAFVTSAIASLRAGKRNVKKLNGEKNDDEFGVIEDHILGFQSELIELDRLRELDGKRQEALIHERDKANKALIDLQLAQEQLINQEKQALTEKVSSLNALVAGVAHEVNTPLGVCITISTSMHEGISSFFDNLLKNSLSKSDVSKFEQRFDESMTLLLSATRRAIKLVEEFKQVAVDHISAKREQFDIVQLVKANMLVLQQDTERRDIEFEFNSDDNVMLDSYPQELIQVVNHLYHNAIHHAFAPDKPGMIKVNITGEGNNVALVFQDNGQGINKEHLEKVYDPFFTTTPGVGGGCGLGLHIVYNIVTNLLGGSIKMTSESGNGTRVEMKIPISAPENIRHESAA